MSNKKYTKLKTFKSTSIFPDTYFVSKYHIAPYRGCQHGCIYCDGRAEKYYFEGDFAKDIEVRENVAELLEEKLLKVKEKGIVSFSSGVTDVYQNVDKEEKLMRKCLEVVYKCDMPLAIMTKSKNILEDIDLIDKINKKSGAIICISIAHIDDEVRKKFEPGASSVEDRLNIIKEMKKRDIPVVVSMMPVLPYISDLNIHIDKLVKTLKELGVDAVMPGELTLRPGRQKDLYLALIEKEYNDKYDMYAELYSENRRSGIAKNNYNRLLYERMYRILNKYEMSPIYTHKIYKDKMSLYDELYILLTHMMELYDNNERLRGGYIRYKKWLEDNKKEFNRKRKISYKDLEAKLIFEIQNGDMKKVIKNDKLFLFIKEIIIDRRTFDYIEKKTF